MPAGRRRYRAAQTIFSCLAEFISLRPIGDEYIRLVRGVAVAIGGPDQAFAVRGKHRERVEIGMICDLFQARAVFVDEVQIEAAGIFLIRQI